VSGALVASVKAMNGVAPCADFFAAAALIQNCIENAIATARRRQEPVLRPRKLRVTPLRADPRLRDSL
jgi:hypothetical protein